MNTDNIVVFVTAKDRKQAKFIAFALLKQKLVACANIIGNVESFFWWQGKIDSSKEVMLVLKTRQNLFNALVKTVKKAHSYENPEIIALSIKAGSKEYLNWIKESVC